jgi:error-prone DNA polymerase
MRSYQTQTPNYAELVCTSNFTFLTGASHPQELVARAVELGYQAIAITDECSLAGVVRALEEQRRCAERGQHIQLIPGSSFRLENGSRLVLLPQDHAGYTERMSWPTPRLNTDWTIASPSGSRPAIATY